MRFFHCHLPLGIAALLMGLGQTKIRLNESKSGFKDGITKAWVAVQEWQRDALALVSQNDAGEVLRYLRADLRCIVLES